MNLQDLRNALATSPSLHVEAGRLLVAGVPLEGTLPLEGLTQAYGRPIIEIARAICESATDRRVVVTGRAVLPTFQGEAEELENPLTRESVAVRVTIEMVRGGSLGVTLSFDLRPAWKLSDSFPDIGLIFDSGAGEFTPDGLLLKECRFHLTTYDHRLDGGRIELEAGVNFAARFDPRPLLGVFGPAGDSAETWLHGLVVPRLPDPALSPAASACSWDFRHSIPGIHLRADLAHGVSLPPGSDQGMRLDGLGLYIYSPLNWQPLSASVNFAPMMSFFGGLVIPSIDANPLAMMQAARHWGADSELVLFGEFNNLTLRRLSGAMKDLIGADDWMEVLPEEARHGATDIGLTRASMTLRRSGGSYEVAAVQLALGISNGVAAWSPFADSRRDLIKIALEALEITVVRPFDSRLRDVYASIDGKAAFLATHGVSGSGLNLDVKVDYPGFQVTASQQGITKIDLRSIQQSLNLPEFLGLQFEISDIALGVVPGSTYEFSVNVAPGRSWKLGDRHALTNLALSASCTTEGDATSLDWQLDARTSAGQEPVPIVDVLKHLDVFGASQSIDAPAILGDFAISAVRVSYSTQSRNFAIGCSGQFTAGEERVHGDVRLALEHQADGTHATRFSGHIRLGDSRRELEFMLDFDQSGKNGDAGARTQALATYHDSHGRPYALADLLAPVFPAIAEKLPPSLEFTVRDAVIGYRHADEGSKWLFGVDLDGGLDLSDVKLPDFPLLSAFTPPPDQTLKVVLQVVGTSEAFTEGEVRSLNTVQPAGMRLPEKAISGLAVAASLRLGHESRQLSLPIGLNDRSSSPDSDAWVSSGGSATTAESAHSSAHAVGADGATQWMMLQRNFGPLHFERVGISCDGRVIKGLLDGSIAAGGLTIALDGLSVQSPLTKFDPVFDLQGLGIDYRNGPLEIGGAFLRRTDDHGRTSFGGLAVLRTQQLSLSAVGSYALEDGHPSLFVYALLDYPLGGPSFFFVTGAAVGFGYNRSLIMPTIDRVEAFPLVQQANLPAERHAESASATDRLAGLEAHIPSAVGEHFLAIGVRFTSFKTINSFALLTAKFGKTLEFDLLGLSKLEVPQVASAQLALRATFKPEEGFLGVRGQLSPSSYLLSGDCHVMGGFAFHSWLKNVEPGDGQKIVAGDFVVTLGGYHPDYVVPPHYPRVPRLGFNWQRDDSLQLKGDAYYALCPQAIMAGAHLEATWHKDQLRAWFTAGADFVMMWQPCNYDAHVYVNMGASYTFDLFGSQTITAEMGADLHLWGPEFSGEAKVHWWAISFTVAFGDQNKPKGIAPMPWSQFKSAFLPEGQQTCGISAQGGLIRQMARSDKDPGAEDCWIVNPKEFVLVTNSVIPSTDSVRMTEHGEVAITSSGTAVGVRPVGVTSLHAKQTITITRQGRAEPVSEGFDYRPIYKAVPSALWGEPEFTDDTRKLLKLSDLARTSGLVDGTLAGFEIRPMPVAARAGLPFGDADVCDPVPSMFEWHDWDLSDSLPSAEVAAGHLDPSQSGARGEILAALFKHGVLRAFEPLGAH